MSRFIEPLPLDETFSREYEIDWLRDMPSSRKIRRYGSGPGPILSVSPVGAEPFIVVVPGQAGTMTLSTMPDPRQFAVFNGRDMPVIVDVDRPEARIEILHFVGHGLRSVFRLRELGVIVLSSCCDLVAYGTGGLQWEHRSNLFCCDEPIIDVIGGRIIVDGNNHHDNRKRTVLDAVTGAVI